MISVSTKPRSFSFEVDGEVVSVPLELTVDEYRAMGKASTGTRSSKELMDSDSMSGSDAVDVSIAVYQWFGGFLEAHGTPAGLPIDAIGELYSAWTEERSMSGEPAEGEPSPSPDA